MFWYSFLPGLMIGAAFGWFALAIAITAGKADERAERMTATQDHAPPEDGK